MAVMMDGSPGVYVPPITWSHPLKSDEDYFIHWFIASGLRLLRLLGFILALTLPGLYVAITTYHQEAGGGRRRQGWGDAPSAPLRARQASAHLWGDAPVH